MIANNMYHIVYLVLNVSIAIYIIFNSFRNINGEGVKNILVLSFAALFCYIAVFSLIFFPSDMISRLSPAIIYFFSAIAVAAILRYSLEYTNRFQWFASYIIYLFAIIAVFTQVLYWIPETNMLYEEWDHLLEMTTRLSFLEKINHLYSFSFLLTAIGVLVTSYLPIKHNVFRSGISHSHFWTIIIGPLIALILQGLFLLDINWHWLGPVFLISLNQAALGFIYNSTQKYSNSILLAKRWDIIENMGDGWIVTDLHNKIVDYNQTATNILGNNQENLYNKSLPSVFFPYPNLADILNKNRQVELDKTVMVNNEYRYLNFRVVILKNDSSNPIGRLITWRDITERRRAEDARQQARNEMFVLLNAISSAASQTASLSEFLSETIYQIIHPFRSQIVFFHLLDERANYQSRENFYLAAHIGLSKENAKELSQLSHSLPLFDWLREHKQPLLLDDPQDNRIPEPIRGLGKLSWLVVPMLIQSDAGQKYIGTLFLGRKSTPVYTQDEIIRLTILSDHIAILIDSDRRRKLAIALSERQRLMRDIHDSISQKLYGLVTLTEAAQAAIEMGSDLDYDQMLSRMGENARQAVKELRLFLFQMLPVDLEKEGLISVLHHRLAAVEGRADIKARFLTDDPILISKRKEIALYYIAQEALNNVLRHAHAESVVVNLKQGNKYVTLEVADDGVGFDKMDLDRGGLGLRNITERVKQENGKLTISSVPNQGTTIKVTFEKDLPDNYDNK